MNKAEDAILPPDVLCGASVDTYGTTYNIYESIHTHFNSSFRDKKMNKKNTTETCIEINGLNEPLKN